MAGQLSVVNTATEKYVLWSIAVAPASLTIRSEKFKAPFGEMKCEFRFVIFQEKIGVEFAYMLKDRFKYQLMILRDEQFEFVMGEDTEEQHVDISVDIKSTSLKKRSLLFRLEPRNYSFQAITRQNDILGKIFDEQFVGDFVLVVDNKEIKVLKTVLVAHSDVFSAMFELDMKEKNTGRVEVTDISYKGLRELIKFMYSGKLDAPELDIDFLVAANKYMVEDAKQLFYEKTLKSLTPDNVDEMLVLASMYNLPQLFDECLRMVKASPESKALIEKLLDRVGKREP